MKGRASMILYGLLILAVGYWLVGQLGGERRRILDTLGRLEALVEKDGEENRLTTAARARDLGLLFARDFEVRLEPYAGVVGDRARISQVMLGYRARSSRIEVDFQGVEVELDDSGRFAEMTAVAVTSGTLDQRASNGRYRVAFSWVKHEGQWLIERAELVEELGPGLF